MLKHFNHILKSNIEITPSCDFEYKKNNGMVIRFIINTTNISGFSFIYFLAMLTYNSMRVVKW